MQRRAAAVGVFEDPERAWAALRALKDAGFDRDQIGIAVLRAPDGEGDALADADAHHIRVDETTGILAGGVLGGVAGWLIGAAAVAVPGLGALIAAGALVGAVGGAGIGAAAGGLVGLLVDHGLSREEAEYYHEQVRLGAALVTVRDPSRAEEAHTILRTHGAHDYHTRPSEPIRPPTP
jgi:hypothetical protein